MRRHEVTAPKTVRGTRETIWQTAERMIKQISKPLENVNLFEPLDLRMKRAGISLTGVEFVVTNIICTVAAGIGVYMITVTETFALIVAVIVPGIIWAYVSYLISKRRNIFTEQLGDCLISISDAMRAGYSFQQALDIVSKEMEPPISQEFMKVLADLRLGVSFETALKRMASRVSSADFNLVVTAVLIQREVGGNLAQILDTISDTIMERIRMKREIQSLTAQGRFSSIILFILPFVIGIFSFFLNPNQVGVFFDETIGKIMLITSIVMAVIGFLIIQRIVDIDV